MRVGHDAPLLDVRDEGGAGAAALRSHLPGLRVVRVRADDEHCAECSVALKLRPSAYTSRDTLARASTHSSNPDAL